MSGGARCIAKRESISSGVVPGVDFEISTSFARCAYIVSRIVGFLDEVAMKG
jgi:hypothetical protein